MSMINNDTIDIIEENLSSKRTNEICHKLSNGIETIWCLSLRKCSINDSNFEKLMKVIKKCKKIRYLNFNLNIIESIERVAHLTSAITSLAYLDTLCLHSSNLKDEGLKLLSYSLMNLKSFRSLDIGDCELTDASVPYIKDIIHRKEHPNGLNELIISSNYNITPYGWTRILIAIAACSDLKYIHMDYNNLDDMCGYLICAVMSSNQNLEVMDFEHTGLSNKTAFLILYILKNYRLTSLRCLNLLNNSIDESLLAQIRYFVKNDYDIESLNTSSVSQHQTNSAKKAPLATPDPSDYSFVNYEKYNPSLNKETKIKDGQINIVNINTKASQNQTPQKLISNHSTNHYDNSNILQQSPNNSNQLKMSNKMVMPTKTRFEMDNYNFINTNLNDIDMHKRDQQKIDQYFKNAANYKNRIDNDRFAFERSLERDFDTLLRYERKFIQNKNELMAQSINDGEIIKPYDDLRFKTHTVLPFNLSN